jgi:WD40 repeat protein
MAVRTQSKGLRLYDSTRGEYYGAPILAEGSVEWAVFIADGSRIAVSAGKSAGLWSGIDGKPMGAQIQFSTPPLHPALSPDGRLLAAPFDETVRLWETTTGQPYGPGRRLKGRFLDVSFSPDGRWLVTHTWSPEDYRLFHLPDPPADLREMQLRTWLTLGARLTATGRVETIPAAEFQSLQDELAASY